VRPLCGSPCLSAEFCDRQSAHECAWHGRRRMNAGIDVRAFMRRRSSMRIHAQETTRHNFQVRPERSGLVAASTPIWQTLIKTAPRWETNLAALPSAG
jgi:hypothetical protein